MQEFISMLKDLGEPLNDFEVEEIIREIDYNSDRAISYKEFENIFL